MKQLYGATETCAYVCLQPDGDIKLDSVGKPAPGVEVKIADNGEVLVRSAAMLKEYHKRPDATAESIDGDGYFHTGDAGIFDADGHLEDHRPRQGRRQARQRRAVRAQLRREQAQVLLAHQGGGRLRRRARHGVRVHQHRHVGGRQLGGAARHRVLGLHRPRRPRGGLRPDPGMRREGQRRARARPRAVPLAGAPLPGAAQGARSGRRRADAHPQGAPRLHRREVRGADRCAVRGQEEPVHRDAGEVRGRPHRRHQRRPAGSATPRSTTRWPRPPDAVGARRRRASPATNAHAARDHG